MTATTKEFVLPDGVSRQYRALIRGPVPVDQLQELLFHFRFRTSVGHGRRKAALSVVFGAPGVHRGENLGRLVYHCVEAFFRREGSIGNDGGNLEDAALVHVKPAHLHVDPEIIHHLAFERRARTRGSK